MSKLSWVMSRRLGTFVLACVASAALAMAVASCGDDDNGFCDVSAFATDADACFDVAEANGCINAVFDAGICSAQCPCAILDDEFDDVFDDF